MTWVRVVGLATLAGLTFGLVSCRRPCPSVAAPVAAPPPATSPAPLPLAAPKEDASEPEELAVLPVTDERLFRDERAKLRAELGVVLALRLPGHKLVPLASVDAELASRTESGERCAFEGAPLMQRAHDAGYSGTKLMHVVGGPGKPHELWVQVVPRVGEPSVLTAAEDPKLPTLQRYRAAFVALELEPNNLGLLLGALGGSGSRKGVVGEGELTLCERESVFQCHADTKIWADRAEELRACFEGEDDVEVELLVESAERCEIVDLHDTSGPAGDRERCLCAALAQSAGITAKRGRRTLTLGYQARDLVDAPRPELRVVDVSSNLRASAGWRSMRHEHDGKQSYRSVRRLELPNLDALAAPLARCRLRAGATALAELELRPNGAVSQVSLLHAPKNQEKCLEKALLRGGFPCTDDAKPATLRLAASWPD